MTMILEINSIRKIKDDWKKMIPSETGKIYLTYDFLRAGERSQKWTTFRRPWLNIRYICNTVDGRIKVILPLIINDRDKTIHFLGYYSNAGYNDVILSEDATDGEISEVIGHLKDTRKGYRLILADLKNDSRLKDFFDATPHRKCYSVETSGGFDGWYHSLSFGMRGTVRNAYNRIKNDGIITEYRLAEKASLILRLKIFGIYKKRLNENLINQNEQVITEKSIIGRFIRKIKEFLTMPFFSEMNKIKRSRLYYLTFDKKIVSFIFAYVEDDGMIIPKCGFDSDYSRYSPGLVLFSEIIKHSAIPGKPYKLDLSRGYHEYKVRWGGVEYFNDTVETLL